MSHNINFNPTGLKLRSGNGNVTMIIVDEQGREVERLEPIEHKTSQRAAAVNLGAMVNKVSNAGKPKKN